MTDDNSVLCAIIGTSSAGLSGGNIMVKIWSTPQFSRGSAGSLWIISFCCMLGISLKAAPIPPEQIILTGEWAEANQPVSIVCTRHYCVVNEIRTDSGKPLLDVYTLRVTKWTDHVQAEAKYGMNNQVVSISVDVDLQRETAQKRVDSDGKSRTRLTLTMKPRSNLIIEPQADEQ